jgi:hypothetical protein
MIYLINNLKNDFQMIKGKTILKVLNKVNLICPSLKFDREFDGTLVISDLIDGYNLITPNLKWLIHNHKIYKTSNHGLMCYYGHGILLAPIHYLPDVEILQIDELIMNNLHTI